MGDLVGAAETYSEMIDAVAVQANRVHGSPPEAGVFGSAFVAQRFRADPHRKMDSGFEAIAAFVELDDVFIDAGGGSGRLSLPMALRCRQVINVDPSVAMGDEFKDCAAGAGIDNAEFVLSAWEEYDGPRGDVTLASNVTYFVRNINGFFKKLVEATRRRVIISIYNVPNPNHNAELFRLVYGEDQEIVPGHTHLLPVLWEMGILPEVYVLPAVTAVGGCPLHNNLPQTREEALQSVVDGGIWLAAKDRDRARALVDEHFDRLFAHNAHGFIPLWSPDARQMLITWEITQESAE